jgi:hypothetical protein
LLQAVDQDREADAHLGHDEHDVDDPGDAEHGHHDKGADEKRVWHHRFLLSPSRFLRRAAARQIAGTSGLSCESL